MGQEKRRVTLVVVVSWSRSCSRSFAEGMVVAEPCSLWVLGSTGWCCDVDVQRVLCCCFKRICCVVQGGTGVQKHRGEPWS